MQQFIEKGMQSKADIDEIKNHLSNLYEDLLLSKEIYEWSLEEISSMIPKVKSTSPPDLSEENRESTKPLFCEENVYYASLCCFALEHKDIIINYQKVFGELQHQFEELSVSRYCDHEDVDRYIIARKEKTYFIAFLSEPNYLEWPKVRFISFEQGWTTDYRNNIKSQFVFDCLGIQVQTSRIPLRFIIQQLHDGYQVVCTGKTLICKRSIQNNACNIIVGFSFGSLLALSVTASLWKQGLLSTSILEKNLCCISLSAPLINLPVLQEVLLEMPQIKSTLHSIVAKGDILPRLMMFLDPENEEIEGLSESFLDFKEPSPLFPSNVCMVVAMYFKLQYLLTGLSRHNYFQCAESCWSFAKYVKGYFFSMVDYSC